MVGVGFLFLDIMHAAENPSSIYEGYRFKSYKRYSGKTVWLKIYIFINENYKTVNVTNTKYEKFRFYINFKINFRSGIKGIRFRNIVSVYMNRFVY